MTGTGSQLSLTLKLREDATLANYLGSAAGRLRQATGVVYLWGAPGSGRSHLLQGLCHEAIDAGRSAIYIEAPARPEPQVLSGIGQFELVCIDDIDRLVGQGERLEIALFHLVNEVRDRGGKLVLAGRALPPELGVNLPDLRSRLLAAAHLETDHLDDDAKLRVLQRKAEAQGFALSDQVGRFIMSRADRNMTALISLLERLEAESLRRQKRVTLPFVREILALP